MRHWIVALALFLGFIHPGAARAEEVVRVAYAGSMGVVMDRFLGPAFAQAEHVDYQGIGQAAYGLAHMLESKQLQADVFISITSGPVEILRKAGMIGKAVLIASTQMVITYSPKSRFVKEFEAAVAGKKPWYEVLETSGVRFGRTDPTTDPQGQNIIFTMLLAEHYYHQPDLVQNILGGYQNPQQIFTEPSLLSRLEAGQIDAASGYFSAVISHHLPYIKLPDEINLSNPAMIRNWYGKVRFRIQLPSGKTATLKTQPLVFYAVVLKDAPHQALGQKFVQFLLSPEGQKMLEENGYSKPKGGAI